MNQKMMAALAVIAEEAAELEMENDRLRRALRVEQGRRVAAEESLRLAQDEGMRAW